MLSAILTNSLADWGLDHYADFQMDKALVMMEESWSKIWILVASYLCMVWFIKPLNLSPSSHKVLKSIRQGWNTILAIYSVLGSVHVAAHLVASVVNRGLYDTLCVRDASFFAGPTGFWLLLFVLGKIFELGDTVLLLLCGRRVSFLHWFHHSTVLPWCWFELLAWTPLHHTSMTLNYIVHGVMYGYFALNDIFDDALFRQRWAARITFLQCTQFFLDLVVLAVGWYHWATVGDGNDTISIRSLLISTSIISSYLVLFLRFAEEKYGVWARLSLSCRRSWYTTGGASKTALAAKQPEYVWQSTDLTLDERFEHATKMAVMLSHVATPIDLATLYGTYKKAKFGSAPTTKNTEEPKEARARMKYRAWKTASSLGEDEAKMKYIEMMDILAKRSSVAAEKASRVRRSVVPTTAAAASNTTDPSILYPVRIAGHGKYLPRRVVSNADIRKLAHFPASALQDQRTGVLERHWTALDDGESLIQNGANAIRRACACAGIELDELDLIVAGIGGHQGLPDDAVLMQRELGLGESGVRAFTVHSTCLSFFSAMDIAGAFMRDGRHKCVAVVASSVSSVGLNPKDPHTFPLFGDGAAAIVLVPSQKTSSAVHSVHMETFGCGAEACEIRGMGTQFHTSLPRHTPEMDMFQMCPEIILSIISKYLPGVLARSLVGLEKGLEGVIIPGCTEKVDIDWVVCHQASALGLDALGIFGWKGEKVLKTLHKYGNTICASIPLTLCDGIDSGKIKRGDKILICGTSAGVSFGSMLITY